MSAKKFIKPSLQKQNLELAKSLVPTTLDATRSKTASMRDKWSNYLATSWESASAETARPPYRNIFDKLPAAVGITKSSSFILSRPAEDNSVILLFDLLDPQISNTYSNAKHLQEIVWGFGGYFTKGSFSERKRFEVASDLFASLITFSEARFASDQSPEDTINFILGRIWPENRAYARQSYSDRVDNLLALFDRGAKGIMNDEASVITRGLPQILPSSLQGTIAPSGFTTDNETEADVTTDNPVSHGQS